MCTTLLEAILGQADAFFKLLQNLIIFCGIVIAIAFYFLRLWQIPYVIQRLTTLILTNGLFKISLISNNTFKAFRGCTLNFSDQVQPKSR